MNYTVLARTLGYFAGAIGLLMLPSALWAVWFFEWPALAALLGAAGCSMGLGAVLWLLGRGGETQFFQREALALVSVSWFLAAALGALPFWFAGVLGPVDAFFESMSGFTTTGASVFGAAHFEETPKSILFWRSFTHWLGGMGIIVLFLAVLPYLGAGGKQMFRSESPGPNPRNLSPRIRDTASILYKIYLGLTILETGALMLVGLSFYEALCQTFGTLATGGFSTEAASIAGFNSLAVDVIVTFFMVCAGANFALYFALLRRQWHAPWRDIEWRVYIGLLLGATVLIALNLRGVGMTFGGGSLEPVYASAFEAVRYAGFQVVSIMTTTGFATADFDQWPAFSRMLLVVLMFVGGCAGSTGGGMKVVRVVVLAKMAYQRVESTFRPKIVRAVRLSGEVIDEENQRVLYGFFVLYLASFALGCLVMAGLGLPFTTALTAVAATLNNIGPGLDLVGPTLNYAEVPGVGKLFLTLCMVLGRLELFSVLALFIPGFWRRA